MSAAQDKPGGTSAAHSAHGNHSPIRAQYLATKRQHPDALLFFRMGDFYELFDEDAEVASRELELTLTKREWGRGERSPMAGVPHHAADGYIARLIAKGFRVAVCEQVSDPALSKGLVEREVLRVVTPGTVMDPALLAAKRNNFLAAVALGRDAVGLAWADITTGEFACTQLQTSEPEAALVRELARVQPAEVLVEAERGERFIPQRGETVASDDEPATLADRLAAPGSAVRTVITPHDPSAFREDLARERLREHFGVTSLEAFGCEHLPLAVRAAGAVLHYLRETQRGLLAQVTALETYSVSGFMAMDPHTRRNLELFESGRGGQVKGSLLWVLDETRTPMGGRLMRRWLNEPLVDLPALLARQESVAAAHEDAALRTRLRHALAHTGDLERLANRVLQRIATPRDLVVLAGGLHSVEQMDAALEDAPPGLAHVTAAITPLPDLRALIARALVDEPPLGQSDGGLIRQGYSEELDTLLFTARHAKELLATLERRERERSGITNLRVSFNKVFGYYIEVTNSQLSRVPEDYIRKQTLSTGERFMTPELKELEAQILGAEERSARLEQELFAALRAEIAAVWAEKVLRTARALAELDVILSLADVAARHNYCRPALDDGDTIHIVAGRHPVVEVAQRDTPFIPNDCELATSEAQIILLTGPNMAGKSTYLRQVALIVLMAQIGSYVPAEAARIGLVDRIFTRIGAQDDLATGQSTFMVEMVETANILHHASPRSLIILDEIGRGTSTFDGLAIARAIVEYLHNNKRCGARTLFATHYHELVELASVLPRVRACNVAVSDEGGHIVFLRKIVPGGADRSYGIHVAQLAGIPRQVVRRAEEVLELLERGSDRPAQRRAMREPVVASALQLTLFNPQPDPLVEELKGLAVDELTPLEALTRLYELQKKAQDRK
ncbi:MAG TPA: DNA mismatch repair protein MutS [Ktedonobacterales bacterium]